MHATVRIKAYWSQYKFEVALIIAYQTLCLISLLVNKERFADLESFILLGVSFIALQTALPLSVALFLLPHNKKKCSVTNYKKSTFLLIFIILLIFSVLIWQIVDNTSAYILYQYFLAGDGNRSPHLRSIFAIGTDLAAILSCIALTAFFLMLQAYKRNEKYLFAILLIIGIISIILGIVNNQRIFILATSAGAFCFAFIHTKQTFKSISYTVLAMIIISSGLIKILPSHFAYEFRDLLPFVYKINSGTEITYTDFVPNINENAMGGRIEIWNSSINAIYENPIFGTSNGGFRLLRQYQSPVVGTIQNAHNVILQSALDAGVFGLLILLSLTLRIISNLKGHPASLSLFVSILASLQVDNFTDHSLPWVIVITYCCVTVFISENTKKPKRYRCD